MPWPSSQNALALSSGKLPIRGVRRGALSFRVELDLWRLCRE
jgi:hypothetical protein